MAVPNLASPAAVRANVAHAQTWHQHGTNVAQTWHKRDTIVAQTHRPQLTTIRQDIVGLGAAAAELMIAQLNGEEPKPRLLETSLVIRETT